jgi:hypothetical protein
MMNDLSTQQFSNSTYEVTHDSGIYYVKGELTAFDLRVITRDFPDGFVADFRLAKAAEARFAFGTPEDCDRVLMQLGLMSK